MPILRRVEQFRAGRVVHMKALKELYNGMPQVNKIQLRLATDSEPNQPHDYRESSPCSRQKIYVNMFNQSSSVLKMRL